MPNPSAVGRLPEFVDAIAEVGPVAVFDGRIRLVGVNPSLAAATGWSVGMSWPRNGRADALQAAVTAGVRRVLETGLALPEIDIVVGADAGERSSTEAARTWAAAWYPLSSGAGAQPTVGVVIRDVTTSRVASRRIAQLTELLHNASDAIIALDAEGVVTFWNQGAEQLFGWTAADAVGHEVLRVVSHDLSQAQEDDITTELRAGRPWRATLPFRRRDGTPIEVAITVDAVQGGDGAPGFVAVGRDVTAAEVASRQASFLSKILDSTKDGVIVTDRHGRIVYWNGASERMLGWSPTEVMGARTLDLITTSLSRDERIELAERVFSSGLAVYQMSATARDGSAIPVEVVASAHRDPTGAEFMISVFRDVRERNETIAELGRVVNSRSSVATSLSRLHVGESAEATAQAICDEIRATLDLDIAVVYAFVPRGEGVAATALAVGAPGHAPMTPGASMPPERAAYLLERARTGPWVEEWHDPADPYLEAWRDAGFDLGTYTPLRSADQVVGLIIAGTRDATIEEVASLLPALLEYAAVGSALLGPDLERRRARAGLAESVHRVVAERAFRPVFQPVVELETRRAVGYEALTRFSDGTPPNLRFADAAAAGLSGELERATLVAAFEAAGPLPASAWLAVNCSPSVIADGVTLSRLLEEWGWLTVVEVTEHEEIGDYAAFRRSVARLGPRVRLSVDDAGAGFASLRHILELGPQFVKLDIGMVRNVDRDPARQALIAGMVHFATQTGCDLIAEGIETEAERERLIALGVRFGQGFLLGRPAPAEELARPSPMRHAAAAPDG